MFTSIIVALDLESDGDRALPVVRALTALADVDVELVTVTPPGVSTAADIFELRRRAVDYGWPPHAFRLLRGEDAAETIAAEVNARHEALLVMATSAKPPVLGHLLGSASEGVLRLVERPVLLVGPRVPADLHWSRPTPIVCVQPGAAGLEQVTAITAWARTFPIGPPRIVEVVPEAGVGSASDEEVISHLQQVATQLAADGVESRHHIIHGGVPEIRLDEFADYVMQPLFMVASGRWTNGQHWHSTTRRLVHRSTHPVLVVPARVDASADPDAGSTHDHSVDIGVP